MDYYRERIPYDFYEEEDDPSYYSTPKAGSFDCVDAVLPWRFEEEPLPPPVPPKPKNDLKESSGQWQSASSSSASLAIPERVTTPWLLRRVKTPVTQATHTAPNALAPTPTPVPQKASSGRTTTADIRGSPKPEPPAYRHAVPRQIHPSEERLAIPQSQSSTVQVQVQVQVQPPRTPPQPAALARRSARGGGGGGGGGGRGETRRGPAAASQHSGCPQIRSVRSAPQEERPRPAGTRAPLRPTAAVAVHAHAHLPSYHSAQPFPSPAPPPYRVSAEDSYPTSVRSRSLPRSSRSKHGPVYEKEATPLPPLPPLPSHHHHHPQLSSSAISRIQAGLKVSKEFGDAIMQQELRFATPTSDHSRLARDPVPNPRLGQRFLSVSELQSHRKARLRTDKITPEHEARLRASNKSSPNVGRGSGDSRQRTVSAHPGRGQDKGLQRGRR